MFDSEKIASYFDKAIKYTFYVLIFFTPIIFTSINYELFEFPKMLLVYAGAATVGLFWIGKSVFEKKISFAKTILFWPIILFLTANLFSTFFSVDTHTSIFGYYSRFNGGLLSTFAYLILFFALVSNFKKADTIRLLFIGLASSLIVALWGIPSHFGADPTCKLLFGRWTSSCWTAEFDPTKRIFSTLGQPNWLAAYLSLYIPLSLAFLLRSKKQNLKLLFFASAIILFWAFLLTNSRSAALGLFSGLLIFGGIYLWLLAKEGFKHIKFSNNHYWILGIFLTFVIVTFLFGSSLLGRVGEIGPLKRFLIPPQPASQSQAPTTQTALATGGTESGQIRLIVWRGAFEIFKHYPLFGSGVETFAYTYYNYRPQEHNQTTEWDFLYNKAHNEYLNYLATTGLFGFLAYLSIIVGFLYFSAKKIIKKASDSESLIIAGILAGYVSYLVQNFFGFSVVAIALLFFLFPAAVFVIEGERVKEFEKLLFFKLKKIYKARFILLSITLIFDFLILMLLLRIWQSDVLFAKARNAQSVGNWQSAYLLLQSAVTTLPYSEPLYLSNLGNAAANLALETEDKNVQKKALEISFDATRQSLLSEPYNLSFWRTASQTYSLLSKFDPSLVVDSLKAAETATFLAPTDPETWYKRALIEKVASQDASASASINKALELKPDYVPALEKKTDWQKAKNN
jgi:O-antigen ligase